MELANRARGWLSRPFTYLDGEWNRMAPRERKLVAGLVGAVVVFAVLVTGFLVVESLRDIAEANEDARTALADIARHREEYLEAKQKMVAQEMRIGTEPPQFAADLETAARDAGIGIPSSTEQGPVAVGKRYLEHKVEVGLGKVDLLSLSNFLSKLESNPRRLLVVTKLKISKRYSSDDKSDLNVDLTATAYERVKENARRRGTAAPKAATP